MADSAIVVAGTDTDVGKTMFSAMLVLALDGAYWKPIQAGVEGGTDRERVRAMTGLPEKRFLPERYALSRPLSPHRAAELDGVAIHPEALHDIPHCDRPLVIEPAGGLLVPLTRDLLQVDLIARWRLPVALCARTALGTINHTLLSIEALQTRNIPLLGVAFIGEANEDSERTILEFSGARRLGRLPWLKNPDRASLLEAFEKNFSRSDFLPLPARSK